MLGNIAARGSGGGNVLGVFISSGGLEHSQRNERGGGLPPTREDDIFAPEFDAAEDPRCVLAEVGRGHGRDALKIFEPEFGLGVRLKDWFPALFVSLVHNGHNGHTIQLVAGNFLARSQDFRGGEAGPKLTATPQILERARVERDA